jgi:hypothetical protein
MTPEMRQCLHSFRLQIVHIYLTTDTLQEGVCWFEDRGFRCATAQVSVE